MGDEAGRGELAAIYDAYAGALYRYLLTLLGNAEEAEDALQELFLAVMRRAGRGPIRNPQAYLFQAARRQVLLARRRRSKQDKAASAAAVSWVDTEACSPDQRELAIDVDRALRSLPAEQREVIALRLAEGMTFREVAAALGIALSTAARRYRLGLSRMRELLEGGGDDE
jgi:RNA polymerase sigma-70 factor (ECF subfamily)